MKRFPLILTLLLVCSGCINTESPEVDEEEEAGWWCKFYNTCADENGGNGAAEATANKKSGVGGTTADSIDVSHGVSHDSGQ